MIRKSVYSKDVIDFINSHLDLTAKEIASELNKKFTNHTYTVSGIYTWIGRNNIHLSTNRFKRSRVSSNKIFSADEEAYFMSIYKNKFDFQIAELMSIYCGRPIKDKTIHNYKKHRKLCSGTYAKGCPKANLGQFQGVRKLNDVYISNQGYKKIKIKVNGKNKIVLYHNYVWQQHYGAIPKNKCITFLDGNRSNCNIENLILTSRAAITIATRTNKKYLCEDPAVNKVVFRMSELQGQINSKEREVKEK